MEMERATRHDVCVQVEPHDMEACGGGVSAEAQVFGARVGADETICVATKTAWPAKSSPRARRLWKKAARCSRPARLLKSRPLRRCRGELCGGLCRVRRSLPDGAWSSGGGGGVSVTNTWSPYVKTPLGKAIAAVERGMAGGFIQTCSVAAGRSVISSSAEAGPQFKMEQDVEESCPQKDFNKKVLEQHAGFVEVKHVTAETYGPTQDQLSNGDGVCEGEGNGALARQDSCDFEGENANAALQVLSAKSLFPRQVLHLRPRAAGGGAATRTTACCTGH
jgi:hypothetical protein